MPLNAPAARRLFLALLMVLPAYRGIAQPEAPGLVSFRASKPYALFHFLRACVTDRHASQGLADFIRREPALHDTAFQRLVARWQVIPLEYTYDREQFPEYRARSRSGYISDLLVIAAVQAADLPDFRRRTIGVLPNADHQALFRVLEEAAPYYNRLVWNPLHAGLLACVDSLRPYQPRISALFAQLNGFYRAAWPSDVPFTVSLYPVPGKRSGTAATPHINTLCVGAREAESDYDGIAGVVLHEMCHSLYNEQPAAVQADLERWFLTDTARIAATAYDYIDEGLATACGNGWARAQLNGRPDTGEWYHDPYIDGYAHELYPLVQDYLARGAAIDSHFVRQAVRIFDARFPRAAYDYGLLLSNISLYADAEGPQQRADLHNALNRHFRVSSYAMSTPILDPNSLDQLARSSPTQVVILPGQPSDAHLARLKAIFPQLAPLLRGHTDPAWVVSFFDQSRRPVILIRPGSAAGLDQALKRLDQLRYMEAKPAYYAL